MERLFFAAEVVAPWPEKLPEGRLIEERDRHLTLAFLGDANLSELQTKLASFPKYPFKTGIAAVFDGELFLPKNHPRVAAYHLQCLEQEEPFLLYQKEIASWLGVEEKQFLPHVTLARAPFSIREWKSAFQKLPCFTKSIRLCESLGSSRYNICWEIPVKAPFESIPHTADLAFLIRGTSWAELDLHAWLALSFHEPSLIEEFSYLEANSFEELIRNLNARISRVDAEKGSPFKAVSYHGQVNNGEWEMIVDV